MTMRCANCGNAGYVVPSDEGEVCVVCGHVTAPKRQRTSDKRDVRGRVSQLHGRRLFVVGRESADNPYRAGTRSAHAFTFVQANPGVLFEDAVAFGIRQRTLTEMVKLGYARADVV